MAGAVRFELTTKVLETHVLPLHHAPMLSRTDIIIPQNGADVNRENQIFPSFVVGLHYILEKEAKKMRLENQSDIVELRHKRTERKSKSHEQAHTGHKIPLISDARCGEIWSGPG